MMASEETISKLCLEKYKCLKKTGKPSDGEWTVLAGFVLKNGNNCAVVSLATGTKCLGASELKNTVSHDIATRLSDSHAEILARRALLRYLYAQLDDLFSLKENSVFSLNCRGEVEFRSDVSFHFYCSQTPCGDCSIILKETEPPAKVMKFDESINLIDNWKIVEDIHRTGAKCVHGEIIKDPHLPGINYHVVGPLRTKPGRGDPTLSLSCSDKLAKWNLLGVQGALLSLLIPKLKIQTIVIGGDCPFSLEAMERGLCKRFGEEIEAPRIVQVAAPFLHKKCEERRHPCPSSVIWCSVKKRDFEVAVEGRKQGATKKKNANHLLVSRRALFECFLKIADRSERQFPRHPKKITYISCKKYSTNYQKSWNYYKSTIFSTWPSKPIELQEFTL